MVVDKVFSKQGKNAKWRGVFAALPTPFKNNCDLDLPALQSLYEWMVAREGISGVVVNTHGGEGTALTPSESLDASRAAVKSVASRVPVVVSLLSEGVRPAVELAKKLEDTGVDGFLVMPPHRWLRGGKGATEAAEYLGAISDATKVGLIVHEYPMTTKAGYSTDEIMQFAKIDHVVAIKSGPRDMARYLNHVEALNEKAPHVSLLSCHDEAILPTLIPGIAGVLMTIGSLIPRQISGMLKALDNRDMTTMYRIWESSRPILKEIYGEGTSAVGHAKVKCALSLMGILPNAVTRLPAQQLTGDQVRQLANAMTASSAALDDPELAPKLSKAA